ncbi:MAG: hypothetical protein ATN36_00230 [Epulopiscium sp. Nele67-Bin005]|nr:MAG: hypothetical protein ATN36_00230 [Epulopiscium sp. Nele67-Bin005]
MIAVRKLNEKPYILNADLVETIEATPDTVITLTTGKKLVVMETVEDVVNAIIGYKQKCFLLNRYHEKEKELDLYEKMQKEALNKISAEAKHIHTH